MLSFAIIMLNTSLHNHNVRDKPTAERFVTMNRGINEGGDLPEELLRVSYREPLRPPPLWSVHSSLILRRVWFCSGVWAAPGRGSESACHGLAAPGADPAPRRAEKAWPAP